MKKILLLSVLAIVPALAQQPKFDLADVHISTAYWFAQNSGGLIRDGLYISGNCRGSRVGDTGRVAAKGE
jgi:hypothetical protein